MESKVLIDNLNAPLLNYEIKEKEITISENSTKYEKKKVKWDFVEEAQTAKNAQGMLELKKAKVAPFEGTVQSLPFVSIVTVTKNRKHLFPIAMQNWLHLTYPKEKLEWVIVDDSQDPSQNLEGMLSQLMKAGHDIKYVLLNTGDVPVGRKRNIGVEVARHPYIMMMDDDDIYYQDSLLSKLSCLITYGKKIAFSRPIAVYDIKNEYSYVLEGFEDIPEASIMFTKEFWFNHAKFDDSVESSEGHSLLPGNEQHAINVPFFFNFLCIQHSQNATRRLRSITRLLGRRGMSQVNKMNSVSSSKNFFKELPPYFKTLLKQIFDPKNPNFPKNTTTTKTPVKSK
jgi:glycosyltransferase involved in cell wall biosynthesis